MTTHVLVVCTGNICRSPIGEVLLRSLSLPGVETSSAGVLFDDRAASDGALEWGARNGFDLAAHRSQVISKDLLGKQDLVLTMEPMHVREVVAMHDPAWAYTFTLRELAGVTHRVGLRTTSETVAQYLARLSVGRKRMDLMGDTTEMSIADPYMRSAEVYERTGVQIREALVQVVGSLWP